MQKDSVAADEVDEVDENEDEDKDEDDEDETRECGGSGFKARLTAGH